MTTRFLILALAAVSLLVLTAGDALAQPPPGGVATVVSRMATPDAQLRPAQPPDQATTTASPTAAPSGTSTGQPAPTYTASPVAPTSEPSATTVVLPSQRPILVLVDSGTEPSGLAPGQEFKLRLEVKNVGRIDAENVQLSLSSLVFRAGSDGSTLYKEEIDAQETRPFETRMRVDSAALTGVHSLDIALRWEDGSGVLYADQTSIGIGVTVPSQSGPQLVITESKVPARVAPGVPFDVALVVLNGGGSEARNVVVTTAAGGPLAPRGSSPPVAIAPGATASLGLRLVAANVAEPGAVTQILEVSYTDPEGESYFGTYPIGLVVAGDAALGPLPIVTRYSFGETLAPGQVFDLELHIENVGPTDALQTRLVLGGGSGSSDGLSGSLGATGSGLGSFAPLGTGNVRYLGRLRAGAAQTLTQRMVVDGAAKPGVYFLETTFEYSDVDGQPSFSSGVISLLVSRTVRLLINPIDVITSTVAGTDVPFSVEVVNGGDATVNVGNAVVRGDRHVDVTDGTIFVGPLDAGAFFPIDATVLAETPGDATITVSVAYTDDFHREQSFEQEFRLAVEEAVDLPLPDLPSEEPEGGLFLRIVRGILGLGASGAAAAPAPEIGEPVMGGRIELAPTDGDAVERAEP